MNEYVIIGLWSADKDKTRKEEDNCLQLARYESMNILCVYIVVGSRPGMVFLVKYYCHMT